MYIIKCLRGILRSITFYSYLLLVISLNRNDKDMFNRELNKKN